MANDLVIENCSLQDVKIIRGTQFIDDRGHFSRKYCKRLFDQLGLNSVWVQSNISSSNRVGTIRGMHYQTHPYSEIKLVSCVAGAIFDVVVDVRPWSPTFKSSFSIELNQDENVSLYIPTGFAHGFQVLKDNSCVMYLSSNFYESNYERGLHYNDPSLKINWPLEVTSISRKDSGWPMLG